MNTMISDQDITRFGAYLREEEKSPATCEKYLRDVRKFQHFSQGQRINKELTVSYKRHCTEQGYAVRSVNSMLASVNCFLRFWGRGDCRVRSIRLQRQLYCPADRELTKQEYRRLISAAGTQQIRLILQTICATGIRVSELQAFTTEAVDKGQVVIQCKGKTRTILIPGKLRKLLLTYIKKHSLSSGPIFLGRKGQPLDRSCIWKKMKALCASAGVAACKVFPHNLRKLFARTFYEAEKDIASLADLLGHSSINTTRIYIVSTGVQHQKRMERLDLL